VLGGTGIIGLVLGFAFRDIAENFLASILMSLQRPFATGDLIQVAGFKGYVQSVNARSSLLMTLEGNYVQIPNATVYKEPITNFTANPQLRSDFTIGIGYDASIARAQRIGLELLREHDAVKAEPEPLVLVENFGPLHITLRFLFWIDGRRHSEAKVKSALMRLTKRAFQEAGLSMPPGVPAAPGGVLPLTVPVPAAVRPAEMVREETETPAAPSEGALASEETEIKDQARVARVPEGGVNLLESR
jgi:small-conductance mechanosensitive channel